MGEQSINIEDAKKHLSELLGRVAYGKEEIIITKRGRPMARLIPLERETGHLVEAKGWLEEGDVFFETIEAVIRNRSTHTPRILTAEVQVEGPA